MMGPMGSGMGGMGNMMPMGSGENGIEQQLQEMQIGLGETAGFGGAGLDGASSVAGLVEGVGGGLGDKGGLGGVQQQGMMGGPMGMGWMGGMGGMGMAPFYQGQGELRLIPPLLLSSHFASTLDPPWVCSIAAQAAC